jgi:2-polyprenyl-6-methoxyphenol hydroxylase-like FAD-dependent oxidoreductase
MKPFSSPAEIQLVPARGDLLVPLSKEANSMNGLIGRRAVVIGAGIGGLAAAGALAEYFEQVVVLERDSLAPSVRPRSGTPQDRHPHGLHVGGLKALDEIFPGFERELAAAGAVPVRLARDLQYERPDVGALPRRDFGLSILCASRPLIEFVLRRRVEVLANVTLRSKCRVTGIAPATADAAVRSIHLEVGPDRFEVLEGDLVVDASGRATPTLALLDALGRKQPAVTEVGVDISYATAVVPIPADAPDWKLMLTLPNPPTLALNAVLLPAEDDRWMVTIVNRGASKRVETWDDFLDASRRLITPTLYNALRRAKSPEGIQHYAFPSSLWRHFEQLRQLPRAVLPMADAFCRFNPIYGQGMSAAAQQGRLLRNLAGHVAGMPDPISALQARFMAQVATILQSPWSMSTSADLAFPATRGQRPERFEEGQQFETALFRAVVADPVVHRTFIEVLSLLKPLSRLQEPDMLQRIEAVSANKKSRSNMARYMEATAQ